MSEADLAAWAGTAMLESVIFDQDGTVVSVTRQRTFTGALRRAITARDRGCQHESGCEVPASRCDVDHIVPYAEGGLTSQFNGRLLCPARNRHRLRRDHARPRPERSVDVLDEIRCRIRWRVLADGDDPPLAP